MIWLMNETFYVFPSWVYRNLSYKNIPLENFINKVGLDTIIAKNDEFHNLFRILIISLHIYGYFYKLILSSNGVCFISVMQRALTNIYDNKGSFEQLS